MQRFSRAGMGCRDGSGCGQCLRVNGKRGIKAVPGLNAPFLGGVTAPYLFLPTWSPMTPPIAAPPTVPSTPPPVTTAPATPPTAAPVVALFWRDDMPSHVEQPLAAIVMRMAGMRVCIFILFFVCRSNGGRKQEAPARCLKYGQELAKKPPCSVTSCFLSGLQVCSPCWRIMHEPATCTVAARCLQARVAVTYRRMSAPQQQAAPLRGLRLCECVCASRLVRDACPRQHA